MKLFISHSKEDYGRIKDYILPLRKMESIDIFLSEENIKCGEKFSEKIEKEINECDLFIILHSENSINSAWVNQEIGMAKAKNKIILPFLLDDSDNVDSGDSTDKHDSVEPKGVLRDLQYIVLKKDNYNTIMNEVLKHIPKEDQNKNMWIIYMLIGALILTILESK